MYTKTGPMEFHPCGREFEIGSLYNCHFDYVKELPGNIRLKENVGENKPDFDYILDSGSKTKSEVAKKFCIPEDMRLAIESGLLKPKGTLQFLTEKTSNKVNDYVTLVFMLKLYEKTIDEGYKKNVEFVNLLKNTECTHVCTKIEYGGDCSATFSGLSKTAISAEGIMSNFLSVSKKANEAINKVMENETIKKAASAFGFFQKFVPKTVVEKVAKKVEVSLPFGNSDTVKSIKESAKCKFMSSFNPEEPVVTMAQAGELFKKIVTNPAKQHCVPVKVYLTPKEKVINEISGWCIMNPISQNFINTCSSLIEELESIEAEMKKSISKNKLYGALLPVKTDLMDLKSSLCSLIPNLRLNNSKESELNDLITKIKSQLKKHRESLEKNKASNPIPKSFLHEKSVEQILDTSSNWCKDISKNFRNEVKEILDCKHNMVKIDEELKNNILKFNLKRVESKVAGILEKKIVDSFEDSLSLQKSAIDNFSSLSFGNFGKSDFDEAMETVDTVLRFIPAYGAVKLMSGFFSEGKEELQPKQLGIDALKHESEELRKRFKSFEEKEKITLDKMKEEVKRGKKTKEKFVTEMEKLQRITSTASTLTKDVIFKEIPKIMRIYIKKFVKLIFVEYLAIKYVKSRESQFNEENYYKDLLDCIKVALISLEDEHKPIFLEELKKADVSKSLSYFDQKSCKTLYDDASKIIKSFECAEKTIRSNELEVISKERNNLKKELIDRIQRNISSTNDTIKSEKSIIDRLKKGKYSCYSGKTVDVETQTITYVHKIFSLQYPTSPRNGGDISIYKKDKFWVTERNHKIHGSAGSGARSFFTFGFSKTRKTTSLTMECNGERYFETVIKGRWKFIEKQEKVKANLEKLLFEARSIKL